ncbi:hypothetical protein [Dyadobacter diqingensis]|uniref:hypothetical protein n=1 Tax=Dyadobacter diqingensis TaxID=2938121 RepID=UPI0020C2683C|nr:hypothetical protein [Dyadobacter diqingensis]
MSELITFLQVIGNLFLAAIIFSALIFTTFYYIVGYVVREIKTAPFHKKGAILKRR